MKNKTFKKDGGFNPETALYLFILIQIHFVLFLDWNKLIFKIWIWIA